MGQELIIVIPVHNAVPDKYERICLTRCAEILATYPKALVFPEGLNTDYYRQLLGSNLLLFPFARKYFKSIQSYNRLLTSFNFYSTFNNYQFMLLHQTDAYVFRDELEIWCKKGYDYIGAPIYEYDGTISPKNYLGTGNGGFSLRNIYTAEKVLKTFRKVYKQSDLLKWYLQYNWRGRIRYFSYFLRMILGLGGNAHHLLNYSKLNEDVFWGVFVSKSFPEFKVAPFEEAYKFSMEYNCENLFELNNKQLPFGCHQWYKGDFLKFWGPYILKNEV